MTKLNREEKEILESYEKEEWEPTGRGKGRLTRFKSYVAETYKKNKRINIRIADVDLEELQKE